MLCHSPHRLILLDVTLSKQPNLIIQQHSNELPDRKFRPITIHKLDLRILMTLPISLSPKLRDYEVPGKRRGIPATEENHSIDKPPKSVSTNPVLDNPWYTNSSQSSPHQYPPPPTPHSPPQQQSPVTNV